jgi:hypothetical protein
MFIEVTFLLSHRHAAPKLPLMPTYAPISLIFRGLHTHAFRRQSARFGCVFTRVLVELE